ncbi:hypothetical protein M0805_002826, partial [Coniferiporia weirii]
ENSLKLKSPRFEKESLVRWELEELRHIPVTTNFSILVQEIHTFNRKKVSGSLEITSKDVVGSDDFSEPDKRGKFQLKLTCVSASPVSAAQNNTKGAIRMALITLKTFAFAELLVKEAQTMVERKKVLLDQLGKSADVLAALMPFVELASDVHPAAKAAVIAINALYEMQTAAGVPYRGC